MKSASVLRIDRAVDHGTALKATESPCQAARVLSQALRCAVTVARQGLEGLPTEGFEVLDS